MYIHTLYYNICCYYDIYIYICIYIYTLYYNYDDNHDTNHDSMKNGRIAQELRRAVGWRSCLRCSFKKRNIYIYTHIRIYTYIYIYTQYICMYMYMYVCMYILYIYIYIYIYIIDWLRRSLTRGWATDTLSLSLSRYICTLLPSLCTIIIVIITTTINDIALYQIQRGKILRSAHDGEELYLCD